MAEFEQRKDKETLYGLRRKNSEHRLRKKQQHDEGLSAYEASAKEKERGEEPKEELLLESGYGKVAAGTAKDGRTMLIAAKAKDGVPMRDEERLKMDGSKKLKGNSPKVFAAAAHEQKSAVAAESRQEKQKKQLIKLVTDTAERMPQGQINEILPFLRQKEDEKNVRALEDQARAERGDTWIKRESRREAAKLRQDLAYKEEEKSRLLQDLEQTLAKQPISQEKKKGIVFPAAMLLAAVLEAAAEEEEASPEESEAQETDMSQEVEVSQEADTLQEANPSQEEETSGF